jgi:hypothetical protein
LTTKKWQFTKVFEKNSSSGNIFFNIPPYKKGYFVAGYYLHCDRPLL